MSSNTYDLVLIKPGNPSHAYGTLADNLHAIEPPLWAALIAAKVRQSTEKVYILDAEAENLTPDSASIKIAAIRPKLIGIIVCGANLSASTWIMPAAGAYAAAVKKKLPSVPLFFWGLHPSALPEQTLREESCDFVINGEGLDTIPQLLKVCIDGKKSWNTVQGVSWIVNGEFFSTGKSQVIKDLNTLPMPAWDLLDMPSYRAHNWHCFDCPDNRSPYATVYTSLGCPYDCDFCALKSLFNEKPGVRFRKPEIVCDEIAHLHRDYGVRNIKILDECFVLNKRHVLAICDLLIPLKLDLNMWAYARIDTVTPVMLEKLKKAGIQWLAYGIESGDNTALSAVSKGQYTADKIREVIRLTKESGISVCGNFMFGLPGDSAASMQATLDFACELNCEYTNFYTTMAYPGSRLYSETKAAAPHTLPDNWAGYSQYSFETFPLAGTDLTAKEILSFRDRAFTIFHNNSAYQTMMMERFGTHTVTHINEMLKIRLTRRLCGD